VLFGGLESVGKGRINVMGQEFDVTGLNIDDQVMQSQVGRLVYVEAQEGASAPVATMVETFDALSIPGATSVFVRGTVDSVDGSTGQISVGGLHIDVNNIGGPALAVGEELSLAGTQPLPRGLILGAERE
jgi:hypothetical protein